MQRLEKILGRKSGSKSTRIANFGNFRKVAQNPHFLKKCKGEPRENFENSPKKAKCKGGTNGNFSKISQNVAFVWKAKKPFWRKWHYPLISMLLKCKDWKRFWGKRVAPKVPELPRYGNFRSHPKPAFSEKVQEGTKENFWKLAKKSSPRLKDLKPLWCKWHCHLISMPLNWKDWRILWGKKRLQKCPNCQVIAIFAGSLKTRFFLKSEKGGRRENFQKSLKKEASF